MNLKYMELAYLEALKAYEKGEVPIGAVIVKNDEVIAKGHNQKEKNNCVTSHAEILAIQSASCILENWRLMDCDIYITLEPCPMCASAIKQARIKNVYCGLSNSDLNNNQIISKIFQVDSTNPEVSFYNDLYIEKIRNIMQSFFDKRRKK